MSHDQRTLGEIRDVGLRALEDALGTADFIRFLQEFEPGLSDYANTRAALLTQTVEELRAEWVLRSSSAK